MFRQEEDPNSDVDSHTHFLKIQPSIKIHVLKGEISPHQGTIDF